MHPPFNRYLVIAWITAAISLLAAGAAVTLTVVGLQLGVGNDSLVPWLGLPLLLMTVWGLAPIVLRRPVLGMGRCPPGYSPRRNFALIAGMGLLLALPKVWFAVDVLTQMDIAQAIREWAWNMHMLAMWMWMLTVTAFPAWHNDPAWGGAEGAEVVPSLPRLAGRLVRRLFIAKRPTAVR